jgi:hypothetical protein
MLRALDESVFVPGNYAYERTKAAIRHTYTNPSGSSLVIHARDEPLFL